MVTLILGSLNNHNDNGNKNTHVKTKTIVFLVDRTLCSLVVLTKSQNLAVWPVLLKMKRLFSRVFAKSYHCHVCYLGTDQSGWTILITGKIIFTTSLVWPASSDVIVVTCFFTGFLNTSQFVWGRTNLQRFLLCHNQAFDGRISTGSKKRFWRRPVSITKCCRSKTLL